LTPVNQEGVGLLTAKGRKGSAPTSRDLAAWKRGSDPTAAYLGGRAMDTPVAVASALAVAALAAAHALIRLQAAAPRLSSTGLGSRI